MKKYVGIFSVALLLLIGSCGKGPECPPPPPVDPAVVCSQDSVAIDAVMSISASAGYNPYKLKKKWKYKGVYKVCWNIVVPAGAKAKLIFHKKNGSVLFTIFQMTGTGSFSMPNRVLLAYQPYVSAQLVKLSDGSVIKDVDLVEDTTGTYACAPPTSSDRDNITSGASAAGTTIGVTVDE